jgi:hypothetical protein
MADRYELGRDEETDELLIVDCHRHVIIARGGVLAVSELRALIEAANLGTTVQVAARILGP